MRANTQSRIDFLYTNIGRGHPHYIDGIIECMQEERIGRVTDVFSASNGIARMAWSAVRRAYRVGGGGGALTKLYNRLRICTDYNRRSMSLHVLGRGVTRMFADDAVPLVVAHPLLAAMFRDRQTIVYQHGEVAAPRESWVDGQQKVIVPTRSTADAFMGAGIPGERLFVSGLCVEPDLVAKAEVTFNDRIHRLSDSNQLCGAFFSSGAEPTAHVESIVAAAFSAQSREGRVVVFACKSGKLEKRMRMACEGSGIDLTTVGSPAGIPSDRSRAFLCSFADRNDLNESTAALIPEFDYVVAPAHERTNWALGLGLPMYVVDPPLGSFAPLNRQALMDAGVAKPLRNRADALCFAETLEADRESSRLREMAESGWQRFDIRGFENIAAMLEAEY